MSTTKKSNRTWLVTLPVAGLAVAYVWYIFLPGQKALDTLRSELESKRTFAFNLAVYESETERKTAEIATTRKFIDQSQRAFVGPNDISRLYGEIAAIAKQAGVETTRFSPDPTRSYAHLVKYPINLGCEGSYAQIATLIEGIERLPQRIWIEHLSVEAIEADEEKLRCEITLEVFAGKMEFSG